MYDVCTTCSMYVCMYVCTGMYVQYVCMYVCMYDVLVCTVCTSMMYV